MSWGWPSQTPRYRGGHLGECLEDYLDGRLSERSRRLASRHLICCQQCQQAVTQAQHVRERLQAGRVDPHRHDSLMAGLLALGEPASTSADASTDVRDAADGHVAMSSHEPLVVVSEPRPSATSRLGRMGGCTVGVLDAHAPAQYSRRPRGPVAGLLAVVAVFVMAVGALWAHPQRNAPNVPREVRMAKHAPQPADKIAYVSVETKSDVQATRQ